MAGDIEAGISGARVANRIERLAEIGAIPSRGVRRLSYTTEDRAARELFSGWLKELGLDVRTDGAGNVMGRWIGAELDAPAVVTGSHLDTQPSGGRFDGIAGVVAGLEAVTAMRDAGFAHRHPIEVINFAAEEIAVRFDLPMIGSSAMTGALPIHALESRDRLTGQTLREVMESVGIQTAALPAAQRPADSIKAVVELHIEQGPYLERASKTIGIVTQVAASARIDCILKGQQAHSGGMPMKGRRDALCGAAEVVLAVEAAGRETYRSPVVATVGYMTHEPQAIAIIPGVVHMVIDVRSVDQDARSRAIASIESSVRSIAERRGLVAEWAPMLSQVPVKLDPSIAGVIEQSCEELNVSYVRMASGGGHDAMTMGRRFPAGMIFVPSIGGISHAPEENTSTDDLVTGTRVLCRTLSHLAR